MEMEHKGIKCKMSRVSFVSNYFLIILLSLLLLLLGFTLDINDGENARFKFLQKHTAAGVEEYPVCPSKMSISAPATYIETVGGANAQYYEIDTDVDQLFCVTIQVDNAAPFIQCQIQIGTDGGIDAEVDAAYITKGY